MAIDPHKIFPSSKIPKRAKTKVPYTISTTSIKYPLTQIRQRKELINRKNKKNIITKSVLSRDSDIMVIRAMGDLDLDHEPRSGITKLSLLDKHSTRPHLPVYDPIDQPNVVANGHSCAFF